MAREDGARGVAAWEGNPEGEQGAGVERRRGQSRQIIPRGVVAAATHKGRWSTQQRAPRGRTRRLSWGWVSAARSAPAPNLQADEATASAGAPRLPETSASPSLLVPLFARRRGGGHGLFVAHAAVFPSPAVLFLEFHAGLLGGGAGLGFFLRGLVGGGFGGASTGVFRGGLSTRESRCGDGQEKRNDKGEEGDGLHGETEKPATPLARRKHKTRAAPTGVGRRGMVHARWFSRRRVCRLIGTARARRRNVRCATPARAPASRGGRRDPHAADRRAGWR